VETFSPHLFSQVKPVYPPLAKQARIQGVVVLKPKSVKRERSTTRKLSSPPTVDSRQHDAVKQWKYKPTLLNGEPVAVVTTITVNFASPNKGAFQKFQC
jgi:protein TonB